LDVTLKVGEKCPRVGEKIDRKVDRNKKHLLLLVAKAVRNRTSPAGRRNSEECG
jgi:hypothetical protein